VNGEMGAKDKVLAARCPVSKPGPMASVAANSPA
jgi:hypothetical protein